LFYSTKFSVSFTKPEILTDMANRRDFLKSSSMLLAGGLLGSNLLSSCATPAKKPIGLQLYSLRDDINDKGILPVLEAVSKMGYVNIETASYANGKIYGLGPTEFKKACEDLGMKITSAHLGQAYNKEKEGEIMDWWSKAIETHAEAGCKYMVQPFMPVNDQTTLDDIKMYCDYFYTIGLNAAGANMKFGYHNHNFEFKKIGEEVIYDFMLKNTSKDHVFFEMDVYWVAKGGANPVEYLKNYAGRFPVLHIKDEKEIGKSGELDFAPIFEAAYAQGMKDWYVEVERYDLPPMESVKVSYDFLNAAPYVK